MKMLKLLVISLFTTLLVASCNNESLDYYHPDVNLYVEQLKTGSYDVFVTNGANSLPHFGMDDIPLLLEYADDMTIIPSFPLALTFPESKLRLGECILWTIESIRIGRNASLGSKLVYTGADNYEGIYFLSNDDLLRAADCYRKWWKEFTSTPNLYWSDDLCYNDPLCGTPFMWW